MTLGRMGGPVSYPGREGQTLITVGEEIDFGGGETENGGGVVYPDASLNILLPFK